MADPILPRCLCSKPAYYGDRKNWFCRTCLPKNFFKERDAEIYAKNPAGTV